VKVDPRQKMNEYARLPDGGRLEPRVGKVPHEAED